MVMDRKPRQRVRAMCMALAAAVLLSLSATGAASAAPGGGQQQKSRLWAEVYCVDASQQMHFGINWSNFQPTPGVALVITVTFQRPLFELQFTVPPDVPGTGHLDGLELAPAPYASWADVETVDARATGAFDAVSRGAVRQPRDGWSPNCPG